MSAIESPDLTTIGGRIRFFRQARGWSQTTLASKVYASKMAVSHWESGDRIPSKIYQMHLAEVLGATREFLFAEEAA